MARPITDKAEVSVDFPNKAYYGSFGQHSSFDIRTDAEGVHLDLDRREGEKRHVGFHVHYYLLADILSAVAEGLERQEQLDEPHQTALRRAVAALSKSLEAKPAKPARRRSRSRG